jgi:pimeloyl-ACP methyl ester carboxylesterase
MYPVVLIHGLIGSLDDERLVAGLAPRTVLTPDLLGYGNHHDVAREHIDLDAQVAELTRILDGADADEAHLVGHSVGGVIAALFAARSPERVVSIISVEGNFTLADAFWSASFARLAPDLAERALAEDRADPARWLRRASVEPDARTLKLAERWLAFQPASTVQAMAASVVETTADPGYQRTLRQVFAVTPVHLVAGELSRNGWDIPEWASAAAHSMTTLPGGHLMMADNAGRFTGTIRELIEREDLDPRGAPRWTRCRY